jgi:hypothetical protein
LVRLMLRALIGVRWAALVAVFCLSTGAAAAPPAPAPSPDGHTALMATALPAPAVQWLHLADALALARAQPGDEDRATLLRHRLLGAHVAELNGQPAPLPPPTVAALIAQTAPLPQADPALIGAWEQAFNRHVQLRLAEAGRGAPPELAYLGKQLMPLGPGAWTMDAAGRARYFWVLFLANRSPTALPLPAFRLQADGLLMDCTPPAQAPGSDGAVGERLPDPGETVPSGAERPFVCRAFEGPEFREPLRARLAGRSTTPVRLLPPHLASAAAVDGLIAVLGQGQTTARNAWVQRLGAGTPAASAQGLATTPSPAAANARARPAPAADPGQRWASLRGMLALGAAVSALAVAGVFLFGLLQGEALADRSGRAWRVAAGVMGVALLLGLPWTQQLLGSAGDELGGRAASAMRESLADNDAALRQRGQRPAGGLQGLQQQSGLDLRALGLVAVLALFAVGRGALRLGVSRGAVIVGTALVMFMACAASIVSIFADGSLYGGEGWARWAVVLVPVMMVGYFIGYALIPLLLHRLHFKLDDEDLTWPASVWRALRLSLNFSGSAAQGEYWGFISFVFLAAALAGGWHHRAAWAVLLLLALPAAALSMRRLRGMSNAEAWGVAALLGLLLLDLLGAR